MIEQNRRGRGRQLSYRAVVLGSVVLLSAYVIPSAQSPSNTNAAVPGTVADSTELPPGPEKRLEAGSAPLGSTSYEIPGNALFVAGDGNDTAPGTQDSPLKTIKAAVSMADSGQTIVLRAGSYHEGVQIPKTKRITLQGFPQEEVWLDGSIPVTGFEREGRAFVAGGWTPEFDSSPTYTWGAPDGTRPGWIFIDPEYPMAAHPDQVWIDGEAQRQVGSRAELAAGTFFVDYDTDELFLGTDPADREVRASSIAKAISVQSSGSEIKGIGVRRFAPSVPHMGAVTLESSEISVKNVVIEDTATTGLAVSGENVRLEGITLTSNGMLGASATYADGLSAVGLLVTGNNTEGFNQSPVSGGIKIGRSQTVNVQDSIFAENNGPGLWFDESVLDLTAAGNEFLRNRGHGISVELSARATIANNVIAGNEGHGIKVNNTSEVDVWNNSFINNGRPINIVQDERRASDRSQPGHDPRQKTLDPSMTWINGPVALRNNVVTGTTGNCLLCVEDYSNEFSAEDMEVTTAGNVFHRPTGSTPAWLVIWSRGRGDPAVYTTLGGFRNATGQSMHDIELTGAGIADPATFRISDTVRSAVVAQPLPDGIAGLLGVPSGSLLVGPVRD